MRWHKKEKKVTKNGDIITRSKFVWTPLLIGDTYVWLEFVTQKKVYTTWMDSITLDRPTKGDGYWETTYTLREVDKDKRRKKLLNGLTWVVMALIAVVYTIITSLLLYVLT